MVLPRRFKQDIEEGEDFFVEVNPDLQSVRVQTAIGQVELKLAAAAFDCVSSHVQNVGCPVCGLSVELAEKPLSMATFDAVAEHEALTELALDLVTELAKDPFQH